MKMTTLYLSHEAALIGPIICVFHVNLAIEANITNSPMNGLKGIVCYNVVIRYISKEKNMKIPVTRGFDKTDLIGMLTLRDDVEIPLDSVFAFAYTLQEGVREVSLVSDSTYLQYLKQEEDKQTKGEPSGALIFDHVVPEGEITEVMLDTTGEEETALVLLNGEIVRGTWKRFDEQGE